MNKKCISYFLSLALTQAYATLPLEFTRTPTFPISIAQNHVALLEYVIKNNTPIALPITIMSTHPIHVPDTAFGHHLWLLFIATEATMSIKHFNGSG